MQKKKIFVLDTNVLLEDPNCLYNFEANDIALPITILEEIDKFKQGSTKINENARAAIEIIERTLDSNYDLEESGAKLGEGLGNLYIIKGKPPSEEIINSFPENTPDHRILAITNYLSKNSSENMVALISLDINLRLKAKSLGIPAFNYSRNNVIIQDSEKAQKKNKIFISYSHNDNFYLERIKVHLKPLLEQKLIDIWDDTKLQKGKVWKKQIEVALQSARIALLLISADFLASDFIINNELPPLLEKSEIDGTIILPIIIKPSRFLRDEKLSKFQASNDPNKPLINLTEGEQELELAKLSETIERNLL